jgi:hypothetical protein
MPGKEIKGRSKIANYRYGGRTGLKEGMGAAKSKPKSKRKTPASFKSKWGSGPKPGTLEYFQLHTQKPTRKPHKDGKQVKKNGPVRPIDLPWPDENDPKSYQIN